MTGIRRFVGSRAGAVFAVVLVSAAVLQRVRHRIAEPGSSAATELDILQREAALAAEVRATPLADEQAAYARTVMGRLASSPDPLLAGLEIAEELRQVAEMSQVRIQESSPAAAPVRGDRLVQIEVVLRAEGDLDGLLQFLSLVENGQRALRLRDLELRLVSPGDDASPEVITMRTTVVAFGARAALHPDLRAAATASRAVATRAAQ